MISEAFDRQSDPKSVLERLRGSLIVSCQALPDEPLHGSSIMAAMAKAAQIGGAKGIRANTPEDIRAIRQAVDLPIIGLFKVEYPDSPVYITPTAVEARSVAAAGADIITVDATRRERPNRQSLKALLDCIHEELGLLAMADVSTEDEGCIAEDLGFDIVSTTMSGYTEYSPNIEGPDFELMSKLSSRLQVPVIAEGRIRTPEDLKRAFECGVYAAVVGGAITRPQHITKRFVEAIPSAIE